VRTIWIKLNSKFTAAAFEVSAAGNSHRAKRGDVWHYNTGAIELAAEETVIEADVMASQRDRTIEHLHELAGDLLKPWGLSDITCRNPMQRCLADISAWVNQ